MVLGKLKQVASPITETLDPLFIGRVVDALFPVMEDGLSDPIPEREYQWYEEINHVSRGELRDAIKRIKSAKAPGPDGIPGGTWRMASKDLLDDMRDLYTTCLREGRFPPEWKKANLVLPKAGKPRDEPSAYRPICLLDEAGKILERIIRDRLVWHLSRKGPDLHIDQYGFRVGRSTIDAIKRMRSITESVMEGGGVLLAVSLDISNAFNTLP